MSGKHKRGGKKSNSLTHRQHVDAVKDWLLEGRGRSEIIEYVRRHFKLERAQTDNLIAVAREEIKEVSQGTIEQSAETLMACFWDVYRKAKNNPDNYFGLQALKEMARLKGLDSINVFIKEDRLPKDVECETLVDLIDHDESTSNPPENN